MNTQKRILKYVSVYRGRLILALICGLIMTGCSLIAAQPISWFVSIKSGESITNIKLLKLAIEHGYFAKEQAVTALMWISVGLIVCLGIPKALFTYFNNYILASVTNRIGADVRIDVYTHLQTLPLSFFHRSRIGHIMSRMSSDVSLIQNSSTVIMQAIDGPLMIVCGLGRMFWISWKLGIMTVVVVPLMGIAIDRLTKKIRSLTRTSQVRLADVSATIEESVRGVRITKSFGMEEYEVKRFARVNNNSLSAALRAARRNAIAMPSIELMGSIAASLIMLIGGNMMIRGDISFRSLIEFTVIAFYVAGSAKQFGRLNVTYQQTMAGAERIFELLDTESDMIEDPNGVILNHVEGSVEFDDVSFEYNVDEPVLQDVSFKINPGEIIAIVGPSGAGKSTIADLIPRFYDISKGQILVEGHDIRHINTVSLRSYIAMVPQETLLFSGTIGDNISYGRPGATPAAIIEAAKAANANDFIQLLPKGYDTELGEGGVGLSGGQRQRIAIARALLKDPKILILDEATSALDVTSENIVQEALDRLMRGRTTLIIAHRLSTVTNADRIIVMDRGRIVESGSFDELLAANDGLFAQLYRTQFRSEEVV